jgi:dimethylglycine dehydrogenase
MREHVGVIDLSPFTKHEVTGAGAEAWLENLVANKVPAKVGRIALCHALTLRGGIRSEFTITKLGEQHYYVVSAGAAERYDSDYLLRALPTDTSVSLRNITTSRGCFVLAGPRSREVLAKLTDIALDNAGFPWLTGRIAEIGLAPGVYALRVNFVGALGWELHFPIAMESLRMEKSYRMWGTDLTTDYTPFEAGLDRFVRMNKGPFIGRAALEKQLASGVPHRFVTLEIHDAKDADPLGNEPLFDATGAIIGRATSGYYGHTLQKSLAIGYVKPECAAPGTELTIEILGARRRATLLVDSPFDNDNQALKA